MSPGEGTAVHAQELERGATPRYGNKLRHLVLRRGSMTSRNFVDRLAGAVSAGRRPAPSFFRSSVSGESTTS